MEIKTEFPAKGHPNRFCHQVHSLTNRWSAAHKPSNLYASYNRERALKTGLALVKIDIGELPDREQLGRLDVEVITSDKLHCVLWVHSESWPKLARWWDWLWLELEKQGLVDAAPATDRQAEPQADSGAVAEQLTPAEDEAGKKRGPTIKIQERARVCKELKDAHPEWTQEKLAMEAGDRLGEILSAESVRNVYRTMGWKWKRGERTR
jgi:hypothetical protein